MSNGLRNRVQRVAVFYLAWGMHDPLTPFTNFLQSYKRFDAGCEHDLYIICKGFAAREQIEGVNKELTGVRHTLLFVDEQQMDIGAYYSAMTICSPDVALFFNTYCEILGDKWLSKYVTNLAVAGVGLVGSSGSYESASHARLDNVPFPNPHLRTNAFMITRDLFLKVKPRGAFVDKLSTYLFEHQRTSLTRSVRAAGFDVVVVGRNGRGYAVDEWPLSGTFRQNNQSNLLIADNRTRQYELASPPERRMLHRMAWGDGSLGRVEIVEIEDTSVFDFVTTTYQAILQRTPNVAEYKAGANLIGAGANGKAAFLGSLSNLLR